MTPDGLRGRIRHAGLVGLAVFTVLGARLGWIQLRGDEAFAATALSNSIREQRVPPPRGRILDRDGLVLADARSTVDLVVRPADVDDPEALRATLAEAIGPVGLERLDEALAATGLHRHRTWVVVRDLDAESVGWMAAHRHRIGGTELVASQLRTYPHGDEAAHVIGYLSEVGPPDLLRLDRDRYKPGDSVGRSGLERTLEPWLAGEPGRTARIADTLGRPVHGAGPWKEALEAARLSRQVAAVPGADVHVTLDGRVQQAGVEALAGRTGAAVMLDVHTGAVLAYVSSPTFDPSALVRGVDRATWALLTNGPTRPLLDRVVRGTYPPASTFKIVTASAAVASGISPDHTVFCNGGYQVGSRRFKCWKRGGHGTVDLRGAMMGSCDAWFYDVGLKLGPEAIADAALRLGLGPATGFGLNDERGGIVPSPDFLRERYGLPWTAGDTASVSIGQGINLATPLQLGVMVASVANGGFRVTPFIVDRVVAPDGTTVQVGGSLPPQPTGFEADVLDAVREGLEAVVMDDHGTARTSRIAGMPYAGKTGTAQVVSAALKSLRPGPETEDHALFVAYAPLDAPEVAVAVVVEHAGGGSVNAAPVARHMLVEWARSEGLLPEAPPADIPDAPVAAGSLE